MASPSRHIFKHVSYKEDLPSEYLCDICNKPILDAEVANPCGHSICGLCFEGIQTNGRASQCPCCNTVVTGFCKNLLGNKVLSLVEAECLHCKDKFPVIMAKHHVRKCELLPIDCNFCSQPVQRKEQRQHMAECLFRDVVCACGAVMQENERGVHVATTCELRKNPCPLECGESVQRVLIPAHSLQCNAVRSECPVKGCNSVIKRGQLVEHMADDPMRHIRLLEEDRVSTLWEVQKKVLINVTKRSTGEVGVFQWKITDPRTGVVCSPEYQIFGRKWHLVLKHGHLALEFTQGAKPVHMEVSFITEMDDGKKEVHIIRGVELAEGTEVCQSLETKGLCQVTCKMELVEPILT